MKFQVKGWSPRGEAMAPEVEAEGPKEAIAAAKREGLYTVRSVSQMDGGVIEEVQVPDPDAEDEQGEDPAEATDDDTEGGGS